MTHGFTHEVIRDHLGFYCEEMMADLRRICVSTIIREAQDCATGVTDRHGRLVAQSSGTPGHYNSIPCAVRGVLEKIPLSEMRAGDVIITNDPWICAGHMPDIVVMTPMFAGSEPLAFVVTVAHHVDMGGRNPGSTTANTTDVFQDGLQIPPVLLARDGAINQAILDLVLENVRFPEIVRHDLECEMAVNRRGAARIHELVDRYGLRTVTQTFERMFDETEKLVREEIRQIPDGRWSWVDYLDSDGQSDEPVKLACEVTVHGDELTVDFTGSAPQARGGINMTPSFRDSYTHFAVRCCLDPTIPQNEGSFRPIHITAEPRTVVSPVRPAPVAGRSVMISRVVDVVLACLSQAVPARARAGYGGCNAQPVFSGRRADTGEPFIFLDSNWGGMGATAHEDGATCLSFPQNVANHPIELLESAYPVQIQRYEIRQDSAGIGRFRGGLGLIKDYRLTADARLDVPGDRTKLPPFGLEGGGAGALTEYVLVRDGAETRLRTKQEVYLRPGDVLSVRTSGGGGLGPADQRDRELIERDLELGYLSPTAADHGYGIRSSHAPLA
jgi:N-methylhydantoinase B